MNNIEKLEKTIALKYFKSIVSKNSVNENNKLINKPDLLVKLLNNSILIDPNVDCHTVECNLDDILAYHGTTPKKLFSTRYKNLDIVNSKSDFELMMDSIFYYMGYPIPINNVDDLLDVPIMESLTKISVISQETLIQKIQDALNSGIALSSDFVELLFEYFELTKFDISNVKNREFKILLMEKGYLEFSNIDEMVKVIESKVSSQVGCKIITKKTLESILSRQYIVTDILLEIAHIICKAPIEFGRHSNRYRKVLLLLRYNFKTHKNTDLQFRSAIKKINLWTKMAKKQAIPKKIPHTQDIFQNSDEVLSDIISKFNVFQLVRTWNYLNEQIFIFNDFVKHNKQAYSQYYKIRNNKYYIKEKSLKNSQRNYSAFSNIYSIYLKEIESEIKRRYQDFTKTILRKESHIQLAIPTSEKSFVGQFPKGSFINFDSSKVIVGISWGDGKKSSANAHCDYDLHSTDISKNHYGWNGNLDSFSGDMTHLNSHGYASEWIMSDRTSYYSVSPFAVQKPYENYQVFFANYNNFNKRVNENIIDCNDIIAKFSMTSDLNSTVTIGLSVVTPLQRTFIIDSFQNGRQIPHTIDIEMYLESLIRKKETQMTFEKFISITGINFVDSVEELNKEEVIDLSDDALEMSQFIDLLNK